LVTKILKLEFLEFFEKVLKIKKNKKTRNFDFFRNGIFAACKEKPNKHNMPLQNILSLPSIGHLVGNLAFKIQNKFTKANSGYHPDIFKTNNFGVYVSLTS